MASFVSSKLSHEMLEERVAFTVEATVSFPSHEQGHNWLFQIEFMEEDVAADDHIYRSRHYFVPREDEIDFSLVENIPKVKVNTEWGEEEVYCHLKVMPLEAPPDFEAAETRTNTIQVDV